MNAAKIQQIFVAMYDQFSERREDHLAAPDFPAGRVDFFGEFWLLGLLGRGGKSGLNLKK